MLRKEKHLVEPVREEWTKYFVNGIECERNAIYQTILDKKFYTGAINLEKKYHFKLQEEKVVEDFEEGPFGSSTTTTRETSKNNESNHQNANFSLNTKKFVEKFNPASEEYKLLVERMVHTVDLFYDASQRHSAGSKNLRIAVNNCMTLFLESTTNFRAPYNDIFHEYMIEYFAFIFDMLALAMSKMMDKDVQVYVSGKVNLPNLEFNTSSLKENWNENWTNSKKSRFLKNYLSAILNQLDEINKQWVKHRLFWDMSSRDLSQSKFNDFKKVLTSLQNKRASLDATLPDVNEQTVGSRIATFFHFGQKQFAGCTPNANNRPKPG